MMRKTCLPLMCCAVVCFNAWFFYGATPVRADDLTYPVTVGEYMDSGSPTTHFNSKIKLVINNPTNGTLTRGLIEMPSMPNIPTSEVTDAKLWVDLTWDNETNPYARNVMLYPLTQGFDPNTVTWDNSSLSTTWTTPGSTFDTADGVTWSPPAGIPSSTNTNVWCSFDITSLWNNSDLFNNGAILTFDQSEAAPSSGFITKQFANSGAYEPYIEVTTTLSPVPEPSSPALLLAGSGLAAMGWVRRRRILSVGRQTGPAVR